MSVAEHREWIPTLIFVLVLSSGLYLILDYEYPRIGVVRIDYVDQVLSETLEAQMTCRTFVSILIWSGVWIAATDTLHAQQTIVTCSSIDGQRQECPADTSGGVAVQRVLNDSVCLLGRSWGYDDKGIWVTSGCSAEFVLGNAAPGPATTPTPQEPSIPTWGAVEPGKGFLVGKTEIGEL
jgi:hypothetical protein